MPLTSFIIILRRESRQAQRAHLEKKNKVKIGTFTAAASEARTASGRWVISQDKKPNCQSQVLFIFRDSLSIFCLT